MRTRNHEQTDTQPETKTTTTTEGKPPTRNTEEQLPTRLQSFLFSFYRNRKKIRKWERGKMINFPKKKQNRVQGMGYNAENWKCPKWERSPLLEKITTQPTYQLKNYASQPRLTPSIETA